MKKFTDAGLRALLRNPPLERMDVQDAAVPGLKLWVVGPGGGDLVSNCPRERGRVGVSARGRQKKGKRYRVSLGEYPTVSLEEARPQERLPCTGQEKLESRVRLLRPVWHPNGQSV
jgi:hypothetical protein